MPASIISENGKSVVLVDCSRMSVADKTQIISTLKEGSRLIAKQGSKNAYVITNVTNVRFDGSIKQAFQEYATSNTPYVKESILVGLDGLQKVMFMGIKALTKRDYKLADTMADAKKFLV